MVFCSLVFFLQAEYEDDEITDFRTLRQKVCLHITRVSVCCIVNCWFVFAEGGREQGESSAQEVQEKDDSKQ